MKVKHDVFRLNSNGMNGWEKLLGSIIFFCLFVMFIYYPLNEILAIRLPLLREGTLNAATYIDKHHKTDGEGGQIYLLSYSFTVDNRVYQRQHETSRHTYSDTEIGDSLEIRYLASDPSTSRTVYELKQVPMLEYGFLIGGAALFFIVLLILWREASLHLRGRIIEGKLSYISGEWEVDEEAGRLFVVTVSYNFNDPYTGENLWGDDKVSRNDLAIRALPPVGTKVAILYLNKGNYRIL
jgi:hypothetical protein